MKIKSKLFILVLLLPRIARIAAPNVQIEDPNYIYGAYLMTLGQQPFHDFAQPNPPFLESIIALLYKIFTVSHRVPEAMTALAYFMTAILIWRLGSLWFSESAGRWASLLFSLHYLVFRYHLFEREVYATLAGATGIYLLARYPEKLHIGFLAGCAMGIGFACKQTALIQFLAVFFVYVFFYHKFKSASAFAAGFTFVFSLLTGGYALIYGPDYLRQTFWFHLIKGVVAPWYIKASWTAWGLGFLIPLAAASLVYVSFRHRSPVWLLLSLTGADIVFFWWVSGAFWPHYLLSTLLPLTILSGIPIAKWIHVNDFHPHRSNQFASLAIALLISLVLSWFNPFALIGRGAVESYGFGGTRRSEVEKCAALIRKQTEPSQLIISDPFIALEAHREKVVKFKDNWGLVLWMNQLISQGQYKQEVKNTAHETFADIRKMSRKYWLPMVKEQLYSGNVGAIEPNYELPLAPDFMRKLGFKQALKTEHYDIWIKTEESDRGAGKGA